MFAAHLSTFYSCFDRVIACKVGMIFDSNKFNQLSLGCFLNVFHSVFNMLNLLGLIFTCDCPGCFDPAPMVGLFLP